jgi:putative spermidine/putrescine transport system substrate-binding protein
MNDDRLIDRRRFLAATAGLSGAALAGASRAAQAACSEISVATWGGDYQKFLIQFVEPPLRKAGTEVLHDVTRPAQRITKLLAERALPQGSLDVVHLNEPDFFQVEEAGTIRELDLGKIPNAKNIRKGFENKFTVPHIYSAQVIVYNKNEVKAAPNSYEVFWDPKYKGKVGIQRHLWVNWIEIAAILAGGNATDYEAGKAKLMELKKLEPNIYPSQEALAVGIKNGETWLTPNWRARSYMWQIGGMPLSSAVPKEGAVPVVYRGGVAKNARSPDCGFAYLNEMLSPAGQTGFAKSMGYVPTVTNSGVPEDVMKEIGFTDEDRANFFHQNQDYIAKNFSAWGEWWSKNFLA